MLAFGLTGIAMPQENAPQPQKPHQECQETHGPRSIDGELESDEPADEDQTLV